VNFLKIEDEIPEDLEATFSATAQAMPRARLGAGTWRFEDEPLARLRDKIAKGKKTLGEVYGAPLRGIVTGLNEAFVIDTPTRDRLVARDPKSAKLLKPFLRGENIKRWRVEPEGLFLINTPKGAVDIDDYPAIRDWLVRFRPRLEKRATKQEWWELQQAQLAYQSSMTEPKLVWPHFQDAASFAIDRWDALLNNKCFFVATEDAFLLALLNSRCSWFQLTSIARVKRGGYIEAEAQYVERLSIPAPASKMRTAVTNLSDRCTAASARRLEIQS
jgi:TaqI-like C-terminal specificity domain